MRVIANEKIVPCDIDGTLIIHVSTEASRKEPCWPLGNRLWIKDPYTGDRCELLVNPNMVRLFREELARGSHMLVWSRGGYRWAKAVIEALGLDVDAEPSQLTITSKPFVYFDDIDVEVWLSERVFIPPTAYYKKGG